MFGPNQIRQCRNITIVSDDLLEGVESLEASLFDNPIFIDLEPNRTVIRIIDDDGKNGVATCMTAPTHTKNRHSSPD